MDGVLYCNHKSCHTPLTSEAWLTSCSHIFCSEHTPSAPASVRKCPCCSRDLREINDVYKRNLNPPDAYKSVALAGFSPSNIVEIGLKALEFLNFQVFHEKMFLQSYIKRQNLKLNKLEVQQTAAALSYQARIDELKNLIQQQTQECEKLQGDLDSYIKKSKFLEEKVQHKNRELQKMLVKYEMKRRQLSHHSERGDGVEQPKNMYRRGCSSSHELQMEKPSSNHMFCSQQAPASYSNNHMSSSQQAPASYSNNHMSSSQQAPASCSNNHMFSSQQSPAPYSSNHMFSSQQAPASYSNNHMFSSQQAPAPSPSVSSVTNPKSNRSMYDGRFNLFYNS